MKLFELNIPVKSNIDHARAYLSSGSEKLGNRGERTLPTSKKRVKLLGSGVEAAVFQVPGEIGVIKVLTTATSDPDAEHELANMRINPYVKFALLSRRYSKSNPHLPRVETISKQVITEPKWRQLQDEVGDIPGGDGIVGEFGVPPVLLSFRLERLTRLVDLDVVQLKALYNNTFSDGAVDSMGDRDKRGIISKFMYSLIGVFESVNANVSPSLLNAVKIVHAIAKKTDSAVDIHGQNVMVRMSVGGPQIVITDPLVR